MQGIPVFSEAIHKGFPQENLFEPIDSKLGFYCITYGSGYQHAYLISYLTQFLISNRSTDWPLIFKEPPISFCCFLLHENNDKDNTLRGKQFSVACDVVTVFCNPLSF